MKTVNVQGKDVAVGDRIVVNVPVAVTVTEVREATPEDAHLGGGNIVVEYTSPNARPFGKVRFGTMVPITKIEEATA